MSQIGTASNKKLVDIYNMMKQASLVLAPGFQRKLVWNHDHKESFLDTVLAGLPFPEVYFADGEIDLVKKTSTTLVVDGQQRLHTILEYIDAGAKEPYKKISSFANLSPAEQTNFLDYMIVIRDLGRLDQEKIIEIFRRINSVNYALNAVEIKNALYQGEFISAGKAILNSTSIFNDVELFSASESSRMKDLEYVLVLMSTVEEGGYFPFSAKLEDYITRYDDEYSNRIKIESEFFQVAKLIETCDLPSDSFWKKRSSLFTLFCELYFAFSTSKKLPVASKLSALLVDFEERAKLARTDDPEKSPLANYYRYVFQNTGSKKARATRGDVLAAELSTL